MAMPNQPDPPKKPEKPAVPPSKPGATPPRPQSIKPAPPAAGGKPTPPASGKPAAEPGAKPEPSKVTNKAPQPAKTPPPEKTPADKAAASKNVTPTKKPAPAKKEKEKENKNDGGRRKLGQILVDLGFIDDDQLWEVLDEAKNRGLLTGQAAVQKGLITEEQLLQALAEQNNLKIINLAEVKPTTEVLTLVPETMSSVYKVLPLSIKDKVLTIAISDPVNMGAADDLRNLLGLNEVIVHLAPPAQVAEVLSKCYLGKEESIIDIITMIEQDPDLVAGSKRKLETSIDLAEGVADSAPVRKLINMVFLLGIKDRASDIHFEPFEDEYKMRYRADGTLYEMVPPPRHLANAIATRIKVMSNLDIAERRLPQDGRIELNVGGNPVDMRVSVLPTMFGESVVVRVLDRTVVSLDLNKIGMEPEMLAQFRFLISKPNGIMLVTGPTGAGKTTTLYSALNELNVISDKIITTEDPIEYDIDGIIQVPINHEIGLTFASALRSILRQDPDKILVGEIRDLETAQIAVQASLTGHIVFSTLHTNDAPSTITRLRDMGLEPYLITATVEGILAQRLVRKICEDCRTEFEPSAEMLMELNLRPEDVKDQKFYYGRGCDRCNNTGHRGRTGIYELLVINDDIRDMITAGASTDELRVACLKSGMQSLRESGMRALFKGQTTIDEIVRETIVDES
jgi:type IV pilus assembly protein PilB